MIDRAVDDSLKRAKATMPDHAPDPEQMTILEPGQLAQSALTYDDTGERWRDKYQAPVKPSNRNDPDAYMDSRKRDNERAREREAQADRPETHLDRIRCSVCGFEREVFNGWAYSGPCTAEELNEDTTDYVNHTFEKVEADAT